MILKELLESCKENNTDVVVFLKDKNKVSGRISALGKTSFTVSRDISARDVEVILRSNS